MHSVYVGAEQGQSAWGADTWVPSALLSDADSEDSENTEDEDEAEDPRCDAEVTALCWSGSSVGVARYLCVECRIEVFEAPVHVVAGETVRRRSARPADLDRASARRGAGGGKGDGQVRILVREDVPPSLLWLLRYLEVHQPQVLLPHEGSEALGDVVDLVSAHTPLEVIRLSAASAFSAAEALPRLAAMYPAQATELANRFHVDNVAVMRAMAALLQFVAAGQSNVADVVERGVLHALYLEETCAEALQITRTEQHPSSAQGRGRAKEGLSLRGLLSSAQSSLGKAMLRQWVALPCCDVDEIEARQSVVAFFVHVEHQGIAAQLRAALHNVHSTSHIFTTMRSGRALRKHYVSLYRTIRGVIHVQRLLSAVAHEVSRLYVLLQSIAVEPLAAMAAALARTIAGVTASRAAIQNRVSDILPMTAPSPSIGVGATVHVNDGVDAVLDELRLRLHELRLSLQSKAEAAFEQLPWELRARLSLRCAYAVPHGYLLCVPAVELAAVVRDYAPTSAADGPPLPPPDGISDSEHDDTYSEGSEVSRCDDDAGNCGDMEAGLEGSALAPLVGSATASAAAAAPTTERERVCHFMGDAFGWQYHHETLAGEYCFKSAVMTELDTWVGDLQRRVQQREQQVRRELDTSLLYSSLHLLRPTRALGELDCLLSFARVAAQEGWCRPQILASRDTCALRDPPANGTAASGGAHAREEASDDDEEDGVLEIENGWHPLLSRQLGMQQLVPFSLHLRTSTDRVCVVLGVNGSGKSVLINAVAHIVFLAHVGCHVPAAAARMSLFNGIFAPSSLSSSSLRAFTVETSARLGPAGRRPSLRVGGVRETAAAAARAQAEVAQSSFYGECVALHRVLHYVAGQQRAANDLCLGKQSRKRADQAAGRALVLLDEFGRGTAPEDGCALLKGTLRYFATGGRCEMNGDDSEALARSSRWCRTPVVLCATHLVEVLDVSSFADAQMGAAATTMGAGEASGGSSENSTRRAEQHGCPPSRSVPLVATYRTTGDPPLPLEWVKIYEMEAHTTYTAESEAKLGTNADDRVSSPAPQQLLIDVTPTFRAVCVTPHTGSRRWEDWQQHTGAHLDAGPALGRQCGLDAELLACWESALRVLHSSP